MLPPFPFQNGRVRGQADPVAELLFQLENMKFSLKELQAQPRPPDLDTTRLESYLTDEDFEAAFKMTRAEFEELPEWKKRNLKRAIKLFWKRADEQSVLCSIITLIIIIDAILLPITIIIIILW